ncbi:MAG TPA: tetratricopeptide repeat protein [Nitrospinaceae bacterium]|jgi:tetratricopeptide (TPR) repeat protein|nr:tetratricopeptide repeat protein [Nitrospinaceae bacterium]
MKEDGKDKTWKDKTGRKYQSYGVEQRLEREELKEEEEERAEPKDEQEKSISSLSEENEAGQSTTNIQESGFETAESDDEEEGEEVEFDLEAQVEEFRRQIEEEPENCVHHYNLGEALAELEEIDEAKTAFEKALELDQDKAFSAIIHFGLGGLYHHELIAGIQGNVVRSSVGLHSQHKAGCQIIEVNDDDYEIPLKQYEAAIKMLDSLQADEEIVDHVKENAPKQIADIYYKWASDLIDKSRQIKVYGDEIKDVKQSLQYLKKALELSPNHSQAQLMVKYTRKMLQEGWDIYDEYGFVAKEIQGVG